MKRAMTSTSNLSQFLHCTKNAFLSSLKQSSPSKKWTVVMGNEAGDLDSLASSIAYSYLQTTLFQEPTVAYLPCKPDDLNLRAENLHALSIVGITDPHRDLLFASEVVQEGSRFPCNTFALVDHNRLGSSYSGDDSQVVAVIDHHEDEGLYKDTAKPRVIAPAGSCSSHIATTVLPQNTAKSPAISDLSTLLLSAIVVDTDGLRAGGKAIDVDHKAANLLFPLSHLSSPTSAHLREHNGMQELTRTLMSKKLDVSHLSPRDLLRRDYKEYSFSPSWLSSGTPITAGLSTVPLRLEAWGQDSQLEVASEAWMEERNLTILGILTTYSTEKKGKHRRQMVWMVKDDDDMRRKETAARLWIGFEEDAELDAEVSGFNGIAQELCGHRLIGKTYKQKNAKATRKMVAPLLKRIMETT